MRGKGAKCWWSGIWVKGVCSVGRGVVGWMLLHSCYNVNRCSVQCCRVGLWSICASGLTWSNISHKKPTIAHIYYWCHFISTLSLRHVSALKGPPSDSTTDTFPEQGQQNELPDVKFSLASSGFLFLLNFVPHLEERGGWKGRVCCLMWILYNGRDGWMSECGSFVEWYWQGNTEVLGYKLKVLGDKLVSASPCLPQIPHGLARDWTRTSVTNPLSSGTGLNVCEREQGAEENVLG